jgi:hypothetical protein
MAPKVQPVKKTKKELKAEAEAAACAAAEEAQRQAEEAARVAEQIEARRRDLLTAYEGRRDARLQAERCVSACMCDSGCGPAVDAADSQSQHTCCTMLLLVTGDAGANWRESCGRCRSSARTGQRSRRLLRSGTPSCPARRCRTPATAPP